MSDSDCDWFDKDDDDLIKDVQKTLKIKQLENTEYIKATTNYLGETYTIFLTTDLYSH